MRNIRMRESDILITLFVITGKMVKIFENNSKLIVTTILCIIYWCEVNAATSSTTEVVHSSDSQLEHPRRGHKRRMTTTEDKSYHPRKRKIAFKADKEKKVSSPQYHRKRKPRDSSHDEHTEKWSIEEVISGLSEKSLEPTTKFKIYLKGTTAKDLQERKGGGHYVRRHHQDRDQQQHRKNIGDQAIDWLLGTIHGEEKESLENPEPELQSESKHEDASTTTKILYTNTLELEEKHIVSERSPDKKYKKILYDPTGNWGSETKENDDTSKTTKNSKLRDKSNSNENVKTLRARGYGTEYKNDQQARLEYKKKYAHKTGHRGLVSGSEEHDTRDKRKNKNYINLLKYLRSSEIEKEPNDPKAKYIQTETEHSEMKPQYIEDKNKHRGPKRQHSENKNKYTPSKHQYDEIKKEYSPPKHQYSEDKKKHNVSKHHKFEDKKEDSVEYQNFEVEGEYSAPKHHSNGIHTENIGDRSKNQAAVLGHDNEKDDEAIRLMKLKTNLSKDRDSKKFRLPEIFRTERDKTKKSPLPYKKIKEIRTGILSREDTSSSEIENAETTTMKRKIRNKSKYKKKDSLNTIRSTRMPPAYELQEENPREEGQADQNGGHTPKTFNEELSPYAMEKQMRRFAVRFVRDNIANVTIEVAGRTVEYNSIILLKMTEMPKDVYFRGKFDSKYTDEKPEKKIIFIVHGLTVAGMKGILNDVSSFNNLMNIYVAYVDKFDIFVIPMANPDGYAATLNSQAGSYWNKNLSPQSDCPGVVLDRNFDVAWNSSLKTSSCSHLYPGPIPFSEAETRVVRDVFHKYSHRLIAYIHVHASTYDSSIFKGDAILYPRGYSDAQTDDDKYIDLKGEVEETLKNASFQVLSVAVDTIYNWYGQVSGSSVDYASSVYGIPYAMEFSMQSYEYIQHHALRYIWGRVIPVVFKGIWKNLNANPGDMK